MLFHCFLNENLPEHSVRKHLQLVLFTSNCGDLHKVLSLEVFCHAGLQTVTAVLDERRACTLAVK